jgi:hypothetical protein
LNATLVMLSWMRPENVKEIVLAARESPRIDEVIIWNNNQIQAYLLDDINRHAGVLRLDSSRNVYTLGRFYAARLAKSDLILTVDDDVLVKNWEPLIEATLETGRITAYLDPGHMRWAKKKYVHQYSSGIAYETLLGYGSCFFKSHIAVIDDYILEYGIDDLLIRKADRLFTIMQAEPHNNIRCEVKHLPGATGKEALYRRDDHWTLNKKAVARAIEWLNVSGMATV